jgi:hypothetical protein
MQHDRHWTIDEANAAIERLGLRVQRLREHLDTLRTPDASQRFAEMSTLPGGGYPGKELAQATIELALGLHRLDDEDIVVRDLERGLIDFPALREDREVYLCWLLGEPEITHWHEIDAGFAGRRPLDAGFAERSS